MERKGHRRVGGRDQHSEVVGEHLRAGDLFWYKAIGSPEPHPTVILGIDGNQIALCNFSSFKDYHDPDGCIIYPLEHSAFSLPSIFLPQYAIIKERKDVLGLMKIGRFERNTPLSRELFTRVMNEAIGSDQTPERVRVMLEELRDQEQPK